MIRIKLLLSREDTFFAGVHFQWSWKAFGDELKQTYSAAIGVIGGVVDLVAGLALLQPTEMTAARPMTSSLTPGWVGYFLLALGVIVLLTGLYLFKAHMMRNGTIIGALMLLYGVVMLGLGIGMLVQLFSMMQGSTLSGAVMLLMGIAMLYSGYSMIKK